MNGESVTMGSDVSSFVWLCITYTPHTIHTQSKPWAMYGFRSPYSIQGVHKKAAVATVSMR